MRIFSRITFLCNLSFLLFIILQYVELNSKKNNSNDGIIPLPFLTGTLVILGQLAIFINFIFCLILVIFMLRKKVLPVPRWLVIVNFIFLLLQVFYFFIY